ncbi:hypothetical protein BC938DRAFT_473018 [Jimgerdemannia flammicorona]|uniref:Uncharacterized protein n=1 Tax=Jimgerdemannia flammicorona TaxID=994334 RepID=A0A433Q4X4_9FUNG|nr:hypothetical protein BC938DRAFT_473018 [Jimgerdemannia flammicorona]
MAGKRQITDISSNQPPAKRSHTSFNLLEVDLIEINRDHVNEIILLNRSRVPDGNPTGIASEIMTQKNYPNLQLNELDYRVLPFLIRSCAVSIVNEFPGAFNEYDNERAAGTILDNFLHAEKDKLKDIGFKKGGPSLYDFISDGLDNEKYFETWKGLSNLFSIKRLK